MTNDAGNQANNAKPPGQKPASDNDAGQEINGGDNNGSFLKNCGKKWQSCSGLHVILYIIFICAVVYYCVPYLNDVFAKIPYPNGDTILKSLGVIFFIFSISCVVLFTKPLPDIDYKTLSCAERKNDRSENDESFIRLKRYWMVLAYSFMMFSLVAAVSPFTVDFLPDPHDPDYYDQVNNIIDKPIAVFPGCVLDENGAASTLSCFPNGKDKPPGLSWILHIGGNLTAFSPAEKYNSNNHGELKKTLDKIKISLNDKVIELKIAQDKVDDANKNDKKKAEIEKAQTRLVQLQEEVRNLRRDIFEIQPFLKGNAGYYVSGGLVVPIYLIVLSMIGAAISLTRRMPEYQKQAAPGYVGTSKAPYLSPRMLREYLVFQIIQFISAPFLATAAYFMIQPDTTAAVVGLAFTAGFTSETVLIWLRGIVDKLKPESAPEVHTGSVVGTIPDMKSKTAAELKQELSICIVGRHDLAVLFKDEGQFVIDAIPSGAWALEAIKRDDKGVELKTIYQRIMVEADKPVPVIITFS